MNQTYEIYKKVYPGDAVHYVMRIRRRDDTLSQQSAITLELLAKLAVEKPGFRIESNDLITTLSAPEYDPSTAVMQGPVNGEEILQFYRFYVQASQLRRKRLNAVQLSS